MTILDGGGKRFFMPGQRMPGGPWHILFVCRGQTTDLPGALATYDQAQQICDEKNRIESADYAADSMHEVLAAIDTPRSLKQIAQHYNIKWYDEDA